MDADEGDDMSKPCPQDYVWHPARGECWPCPPVDRAECEACVRSGRDWTYHTIERADKTGMDLVAACHSPHRAALIAAGIVAIGVALWWVTR
jgi:hypothetical protein